MSLFARSPLRVSPPQTFPEAEPALVPPTSYSSEKAIHITPAVIVVNPRCSRKYQTMQWRAETLTPKSFSVGDALVVSECSYFEVRIESIGASVRNPTIGIGFAAAGYNSGMVGWKYGSIGYHADDGKIFMGDGQGVVAPNHHQAGVGDTMGCLRLPSGRVSFTKNGVVLDKGYLMSSQSENYFPTITWEVDEQIQFAIIREPGFFMFLSLNSLSVPAAPSQPTTAEPTAVTLAAVPMTPPRTPIITHLPKEPAPAVPEADNTEVISNQDAIEMIEKLSGFIKRIPQKEESDLRAKRDLEEKLSSANEKAVKFSDPLQRFKVVESELDCLDMDKLKRLKEQLNKALSMVQEAIEEKDKCIVCMEVRRTIAFLPCKHVCCCASCSDSIKTCPICRANVTERLCLYIS